LDMLRLGLEEERLRLEQQRAVLEGTMLRKHLPVIISAAIAFAGIVVSLANVRVAYVIKEKDLDIATRKELREFVAQHREIIFGVNRTAAEEVRNTMRATFPADLLAKVLPQIESDAPAATRDLFATQKITGRRFTGKFRTWGGPSEQAVTPSEGLALVSPSDLPNFSQYFLKDQPEGTTGLARRLDPESFYIAARWNYAETSREYLRTHQVTVINASTGTSTRAQPVDWGPSALTGRVADISPGLAKHLDLGRDDDIIVQIP